MSKTLDKLTDNAAAGCIFGRQQVRKICREFMKLPVEVISGLPMYDYFVCRMQGQFNVPGLAYNKDKTQVKLFFQCFRDLKYEDLVLDVLLENRRWDNSDHFRARFYETKCFVNMLTRLEKISPEVQLFLSVSFYDLLEECREAIWIKGMFSPKDIIRSLDQDMCIDTNEHTSFGEVLANWYAFTERRYMPDKETIKDFDESMHIAFGLFWIVMIDGFTETFVMNQKRPCKPKVCKSLSDDKEECSERNMSESVK